jgi:hypothetical protein
VESYGYYVTTVWGRADLGVVERYVQNQGKSKEKQYQLSLSNMKKRNTLQVLRFKY